MNRKIISRILVFLMGLLLLTGCIEKKETVQETADAGTTQEVAVAEAAPGVILPQDAKIGIAYVGESGGFTVDFLAKTEGYLIAAGVAQENIERREVSSEELAGAAEEMIDAGCSVLMIGNADEAAAAGITKAASKADIPVVYFGTDPGEKERKSWEDKKMRIAYVGGNNAKAAQQRADLIESMWPEKIDLNENDEIGLIVLRSDEDSDGSRINRETIEALKERDLTFYILDEEDEEEEEEETEEETSEETSEETDGNAAEAGEEAEAAEEGEEERDEQGETYSLVVEKMREYGKELELILCANERQALGALNAVTDERRLVGHDVMILGLDTGNEILAEIAKGNIAETFFDDSMAQARSAADDVLAFLRGNSDVPYVTLVDYVNVTVDNAQEIIDVLSKSQGAEEEESGEEESEDDESEDDESGEQQ